ncbi:Dipeptide and tripeptide permease A [Aquicella siphonis]|uniref:Dipeptide and tripeptide permease A n=1 Tax=Aquicella siphonis TaxID=254247 RepID=A0A5E4PKG8_9COXI|nr:peptide MFS transporter [Aquicella siphonis]VVC76833.1 Dipeptide and tripeptide permease A [Aquicella siphonis]
MDAAQSRHPKVLPFLFLTEMWERFGFYVAQGLLVLYMTRFYGFSDDLSYTISGIFAGLVYISPFIGGFLADRMLGYQTAILWGGLFLVFGYALLALSSHAALFYPALATIIIGNGLLKPNISSLLGTQYATDDPRRDSGFTIFYIGINIGAALSGLSGYVKNAFGWQITFALASLGMVIGLITFLNGIRFIKNTQTLKPVSFRLKLQLLFYCLLAIAGVSLLFKINVLANWLLPATGIILLVFLIVLTLQQNAEYRKRMIVLNTLIISSIVFWMLFLQLFNSANLYIDRLVDKNLFGLQLTTTVFYASESVFIILLGPFFAWSWQTLAHNNKNPSPITKFVLGIFCAGLGFLVMGISTHFSDAAGLINPLWIFFAYLLITIGELLLSPIGLSAVTLLAPPNLIGMMMGIWFVATGFGGIFAGWIAKLSSIPDAAASTAQKLAIYQAAFYDYAYLAFFIAIALFFVQIGMKKIMRT